VALVKWDVLDETFHDRKCNAMGPLVSGPFRDGLFCDGSFRDVSFSDGSFRDAYLGRDRS
jgi:hypothetical protein